MGEIVGLKECLEIRESLREKGRAVVFTNGHFDLLHVGHVRYLQGARAAGDALIVGLNSDKSTRLLKGQNRPIVPQGERATMLAAMWCVDYVVLFDTPTCEEMVDALRPDVYVKGGDYSLDGDKIPPEALVVLGYGGRVEFVPYLSQHSTTNLVERVLEIYCRERC